MVITLVLLQHIEPMVHFSLGPDSHSFCDQKRTRVKIFLIVRTLSVFFTNYCPESFKCCSRNEEQLDFM